MKTHLTQYERERIEWLRRLKTGVREIARRLGRCHSVVSRELRRNKGGQVRYTARKAAEVEGRRRHRRKGMKLEKDLLLHDHVVRELRSGN